MITKADVLNDLIWTIPLLIWMLFVIKYLARWVFNLAVKKGFPSKSATYFGRKIIHIFGSGLITIFIPFFFKEPIIPALTAFLLALYTFLPHKKNKLFGWFQDKENIHEVNFSIMWGVILLVGWLLDNSFWLGVIPLLFLSFGDGITGIVRNLKYKKRTKAWEGSLVMLICCGLTGGLKMGWAGILAAILATLVERIEVIDDNILVPLVSFLTLVFFRLKL